MKNLPLESVPYKRTHLEGMQSLIADVDERLCNEKEKYIERQTKNDKTLASRDNSFKRHAGVKPSKFKNHFEYRKARYEMSMLREVALKRNMKRVVSPLRKTSNTFRAVRYSQHTAKRVQVHSTSGCLSGGGSGGSSDSDGGSDCPPGPDCYYLSPTPLPFVPIQKIKTSFDPTYHFIVPSSVLGGEAA